MSDYKTEVIILKYWKSKEYDRIYSVFSREHGKMRVVGIGTRRPKAKLASGLESLTRSDIFLVKCRYLDRVTGAIILRPYKELKQDLDNLVTGRRTLDILEKILPDSESNETMFLAVKDYLKLLNELASNKSENNLKDQDEEDRIYLVGQLAQLSLLWKAIYWHGYFPRFSNCAYCNSKIPERDQYLFVMSRGVNCGCEVDHSQNLKLKLSKNTIKLIKFLVARDITDVAKLKIQNKDLQNLRQFTRLILEQIIERKIMF